MFIPDPETAQPGDIVRAKWMLDESATLAEAAAKARAAADALQALHDAGWTLVQDIEDDYGTLVSPTGDSGPNRVSDESMTPFEEQFPNA